MPIINRPASAQQAPPKAPPHVQEPAAAEVPPPAPAPGPSSTGPNIVPWAMLAMILGMTLSVGGYYGYASLTQAGGPDEPSVDATDIAIDVERYTKVSSLASLSEQEYQANFVALQEAEKVENTQTYAALEIIVNKNRQDLAEHKKKLVEVLLDMSELAAQRPELVVDQFDKAIADAERKNSVESVRLLRLGRKILEGTPTEGDRTSYLEKALADSL